MRVHMSIKSSTRQLLKLHWYQHLQDVPITVQWHLTHLYIIKNIVQENHSDNLQIHLVSNIRMMFVGFVQRRQIIRQPKKAMCCGQTSQSAIVILKTKSSERPFTIVIYIIPRLWNIQLKIFVFKYILMATLKNNSYQIFYWKFLYEKFIIEWKLVRPLIFF